MIDDDSDLNLGLEPLFDQLEFKVNLDEILQSLVDGVLVQDTNRRIVFANRAAAEMMGYPSVSQMIGRSVTELLGNYEIVNEAGEAFVLEQLPAKRVLRGESDQGSTQVVCWRNKSTGDFRWSEIKAQAVRDKNETLRFAVSLFRDITKQKQIEQELGRASRRNQHILESITDGFFALDNSWNFTYINKQAEKLFFARPKTELLGQNIFEAFPQSRDTEVYRKLQEALVRGESLRHEEFFPEADRWIEISVYPSVDGIAVYMRDITGEKQTEDRLKHQYYYDGLTDLPNRIYLLEKCEERLKTASAEGKNLALALIDLDRFKQINESLGHAVGDRLIQEAALRLRACVREECTLARLGGDEFGILMPEVETEEDVAQLAGKILDDFKPAFYVETHELYISPSIGISLFPYDGKSPAVLMRNAEAALYRAKDRGRNNYQFYTTTMNSAAFERLTMESKLRHAIENNEFVLFYQPQIEVNSGKIVGAEELIRWQRSDGSLIPPDRFIPLAEANGLIEQIGAFALTQSLRQAKLWHDAGFKLIIAINLSPRQFKQKKFENFLIGEIEQSGLDPNFIELELTETVLAENPDTVFNVMQALRGRGVRFCLDDFSTGYSSLRYIKQFPVDMLKIERTFMRGIPLDIQNAAIAKSIITLGQSLGMEVTAEGVESKTQLRFLRDNLCNRAQGYLFNGAMPAHSLTEILGEDRYVSVVANLNKPTK